MESRIQYAKTEDGVSIAYSLLTSWVRRFEEWPIANRESLMMGTQQ